MARKSFFGLLRKSTLNTSSIMPTMRIFVRGLKVEASIGVHPHEHETLQPIIIDIELDMGDMPAPSQDKLAETLDYGIIASAAKEMAQQAHIQLVETLAERIAIWCLETDPRVQVCAVSIAKPQALNLADAAGVEIVRHR